MPVCAKAIQQADGTYLLALDPANTQASTCAYVVDTGSSSAWAELGSMTINDATVITGSAAAVWAIAWGIRLLAQFLNSHKDEAS
jgi:hypothetical protein